MDAQELRWTKAIGLCYATSYPRLKKRQLESILIHRSERVTAIGFWLAFICHGLLMTWCAWDLAGIELWGVPRRHDREYIKIGSESWGLPIFFLGLGTIHLLERAALREKSIPTFQFIMMWTVLFLLHLTLIGLRHALGKDEDGRKPYDVGFANGLFGITFAASIGDYSAPLYVGPCWLLVGET